MLEAPALLLLPPEPDGARRILQAGTGERLGFACRRAEKGLRQWLHGSVLEVHEEEDAPLLLTVERPWRWSGLHHVRDADGCVVGILAGRFVLNEFKRWIAAATQAGPDRLSVDSAKGDLLATVDILPDGVRLEFSPRLAPDPFMKMLLLAAALQVPVGR